MCVKNNYDTLFTTQQDSFKFRFILKIIIKDVFLPGVNLKHTKFCTVTVECRVFRWGPLRPLHFQNRVKMRESKVT